MEVGSVRAYTVFQLGEVRLEEKDLVLIRGIRGICVGPFQTIMIK